MADMTLSDAVKDAFRVAHTEKGWIEPLLNSISAADFATAIWKAGVDVPSIWELLAHAVPYIEVLAADLTGPLAQLGPDWPAIIEPTPEGWTAMQERTRAAINRAQTAIDSLDEAALLSTVPGRNVPTARRVIDLAVHGAYHAGQVVKLEQTYRAAGKGMAHAIA